MVRARDDELVIAEDLDRDLGGGHDLDAVLADQVGELLDRLRDPRRARPRRQTNECRLRLVVVVWDDEGLSGSSVSARMSPPSVTTTVGASSSPHGHRAGSFQEWSHACRHCFLNEAA